MIEIHDLLGVHLSYCTAEDCSILAVHIYEIPVDQTIAGHNAVAGSLFGFEVEISVAGRDLRTYLHETVFVEQSCYPSAR